MALKWGILTAGNIAHKFAEGVSASKTGEVRAVGARDLDRARTLARPYGASAYGSYEEVVCDPDVDAVYVATPHHLHAEWTVRAAREGKAVLCEKPFTLTAPEAESALGSVRESGVFFMEAFMYRCSPQTRAVERLLKDGAIGKVKAVAATFCFKSKPDWQNFRTDGRVGGGGLLDVGSYCTSFARMAVGEEPVEVTYTADLSRGYDSFGAGTLVFPGGALASIACGIHLTMRNDAVVYGEEGMLVVDEPWKSFPGSHMTLLRDGKDPEVFEFGCTGTELYAYEADAVAEFLDRRECPYVSWEDTLANMRCLDRLRAACGYEFSV
ncbi:MAG: Gfo/Idh/MocA family oxidoreductase [Armatimonadetes bacterium]|nr:Gfo/Idh/MocA family oxidoreductase [Armatimonadota bacterium]